MCLSGMCDCGVDVGVPACFGFGGGVSILRVKTGASRRNSPLGVVSIGAVSLGLSLGTLSLGGASGFISAALGAGGWKDPEDGRKGLFSVGATLTLFEGRSSESQFEGRSSEGRFEGKSP